MVGAIVRGFSRRRILFVHAAAQRGGPAFAVLGMRVPGCSAAPWSPRAIFGMAGFGRFAADGALRGDVPVVQGDARRARSWSCWCSTWGSTACSAGSTRHRRRGI